MSDNKLRVLGTCFVDIGYRGCRVINGKPEEFTNAGEVMLAADKELTALRAENERLEDLNERVTHELNEAIARIAKLEAGSASLRHEHGNLREAFWDQRSKLEELEASNAALSA